MQYHPDDFIALSDAVIEEGGRTLAEPCEGVEYKLKVPLVGKRVWKRFFTTRCDNSARMEIPYDPSLHIRLLEEDELEPVTIVDHPGEHDKPKRAVVCAVDDAVGLWPRYNGVVSVRSYQAP